MAANENQKLKTLWLMRLLEWETDESRGVSMSRIIEYLASKGIAAERKSIYADIEVLRAFGMDIEVKKGRYTDYRLLSREFELPELKLLVDAVSASRFITDKKSLALIKKLESLASAREARELSRQVFVRSRVKSMNESIYYTVDAVHSAISSGKKLLFKYFDYSRSLERVFRRGGNDYEITPLALICSEENYYLAAYSPERDAIVNFRADRMASVRVSRADVDSNELTRDFSPFAYADAQFSMYSGERKTVTLSFDNSLTTVVIDRFGRNVMLRPDGERFNVDVTVDVSPVFYSWVFMFGERARIVAPDDVREEFALMAREAANR